MSPVLPGAEPFDHSGGPVGVLLCHGFTGSPQTLRGWADYLAAQRPDGQPSAAARARHHLAGSRPDRR